MGRAGGRLIGLNAKVLVRGSNACRGSSDARAELHGVLVAFLRVGQGELMDDIVLMAHLHFTSCARPDLITARSPPN
jgi:hypothetical protein